MYALLLHVYVFVKWGSGGGHEPEEQQAFSAKGGKILRSLEAGMEMQALSVPKVL
jgi:hypothetical protein